MINQADKEIQEQEDLVEWYKSKILSMKVHAKSHPLDNDQKVYLEGIQKKLVGLEGELKQMQIRYSKRLTPMILGR